MVPVAKLQSGCFVTDAVGAAGPAGIGLTITEPALDTQVVIALRTVTAYKPGATLKNVGKPW